MAINLLFRRGAAMRKTLLGGLMAAVALPCLGLEGDASAALDLDAGVAGQVTAHAGSRHGLTLAKARKRKRPAGAGSSSKPDTSDDSSGGDDDAGKSSSASSDSGDDAKEDAVLGTSGSKKKKAPPPAADDGDTASNSSGAGDEGASSKASSKNVESVSAKASEEQPASAPTASALEFGVGGKAMFRSLAWTADGASAGLGPYSLTPGPETGLWLEFYPAAFGSSGFAANVGIFGRFDYGFGVATTLANGMDAATKFRDFMGGLKVRIPVGTFTPNISVAYGQQMFEIAQQQTMADLPQVAYQFVRPALGARYMFTPTVGLDVVAGYLLVLDPGSGADHIRSSRFFPKASSYGIDASASVAFKLTGSIGGRVGADWRQYGIALNPDSSTRKVAGAVDRYIVAWAGLEVVLDGQGGAAGGDDEPVKPSKRRRRHAPEPKPDDSESSDDDSSSSNAEDE
jgi:hypothetical protein